MLTVTMRMSKIFEYHYEVTANKLWEVFLLRLFLTVVTLLIGIGVVIAYITLFNTKTPCALTSRMLGPATVKVIHSELNTYNGTSQEIQGGMSTSKTVNVTQMCPTTIMLYDQQEKVKQLKLVCYYTFPTPGGLAPKNIDPFLCTHINIAPVGIKYNKLEPLTEEKRQVIESVAGLRIRNKDLKVLLCVGGDPVGFADMVTKWSSRRMFIKDLLSTILFYSLDGVDFDWEFPAWPGKISERKKFTIFLKELRAAVLTKRLDIIVSVAVAAPKSIVDVSYDVLGMERYIDYVNVMTYDFHFYTQYLPMTGPNAPLYSLPSDKGYFSTLNTNWSSLYWYEKGMPKNKIVVGIPTYGHSFRLINTGNHGWSAPASGVGETGTHGFVSYPEVCQFLHVSGSTYEFDGNMKVPYAYRGFEWLSYEDVCSVAYKANYIVSGSFGGAMVFSLNEDDHQGLCAGTPFLLTLEIKNII